MGNQGFPPVFTFDLEVGLSAYLNDKNVTLNLALRKIDRRSIMYSILLLLKLRMELVNH